MNHYNKSLRRVVVYSFLVAFIVLSIGFLQRQFEGGVLLGSINPSSQTAAICPAYGCGESPVNPTPPAPTPAPATDIASLYQVVSAHIVPPTLNPSQGSYGTSPTIFTKSLTKDSTLRYYLSGSANSLTGFTVSGGIKVNNSGNFYTQSSSAEVTLYIQPGTANNTFTTWDYLDPVIGSFDTNVYLVTTGNLSSTSTPPSPTPSPTPTPTPTPSPITTPPSNLTAVLNTTGKVTLNWQNNTAGSEGGFALERADGPNGSDAFHGLANTGTNATNYIDNFSNVLPTFPTNTGEQYRARAFFSDGTHTGYSNIATVSNCVRLSGNGPRKIVFIRKDIPGQNNTISNSLFLSKVNDVITNGFGNIDPFKKYFSSFSFYLDFQVYRDSPSSAPTDPNDRENELVINSNSCGSNAFEYILFFFDASINHPDAYVQIINDRLANINVATIPFPLNNITLPSVAIHETAHAVAGINDEYVQDQRNKWEFDSTNCSINPINDYTNVATGLIYGSTNNFPGCLWMTNINNNPIFRPSLTSIMEQTLETNISNLETYIPSNRFNVISCGYIVSAIIGEPVDKAHAQTHWAECWNLNTEKDRVRSTTPIAPVVTLGLSTNSAQLQLTIPMNTDAYVMKQYDVYRSNAPIRLGTLLVSIPATQISTSTDTIYTDSGLLMGYKYCYTVKVTDIKNVATTSTPVCNTMIAPKLSAPSITGVYFIPSIKGTEVDWTASTIANGTDPTGYYIYKTGAITPLTTITNPTLLANFTGLTLGTKYCYQVQAYQLVNKTIYKSARSASSCANLPTTAGSATKQSLSVTTTPNPTPIPTVTISTNPASIPSGSSGMIVWSSTDSMSCTMSGGFTADEPTSGAVSTGTLTDSTTYTMTCSGDGGSASASTVANVI